MSIFRIATIAAVAICGGLSACSVEDPGRTEFGPKPLFDPIVLPSSSTGSAVVPLPFDGLFGTGPQGDGAELSGLDAQADGTLNLFPLLGAAALAGGGQIDGWSTTAALFMDVVGDVDLDNAAAGIRIFDSKRFAELQPGVDFEVEPSPVVLGRTRLLVQWLKPLSESTQYLIALTSGLRSSGGAPGLVNELFEILRDPTPVTDQSNTILAALALSGRQADIGVLAQLQQQLVHPVVDGVIGLSAAAPNSRAVIARDDILLAWSFTTQSITPSLVRLAANAQAQAVGVQDSGLDLSVVLASDPSMPAALPADADIYAGFLQLPYFLSDEPAQINSTFWLNDGAVSSATHPALGASCGSLLRPASTTICYPDPAARSVQTVPVLLTRPHTPMPASGWPVVIFQHGITGDRSNMFGIAPALSAAGFVVIAIDLPLHGVAAGSPLRVPGTTERTFDADLDGNNVADASGSYFINLSSTVTSRDNLRQAVVDLLHLAKSLANVRLGSAFNESLDLNRVGFIGHSLGGIVGSTFLALTDEVGAATLAMPGGGIAKLLDGSETFGPVVAAGLAANGINEGTDTYEVFLRLAQLSVDSGDPINWAAATADRHPIHLIEVVGDAVVPNNVMGNPQALIDGPTSGTGPLAAAMGLPTTPVTAPISPAMILQGSNRVLFSSGTHSSIVRPATANPVDDPVFLEMQSQTVQFLASEGACLPLGTTCPQSSSAGDSQ